jgi:pimeloyl-ACP methyl ester carboxylesterase
MGTTRDPLQTAGALVPETAARTTGPGAGSPGWRNPSLAALHLVRDQYRRQVRKTPQTRMVPGSLLVDDRVLRFAVSDNEAAHGPDGAGSPPIWAVNLHGYFAGGGMYWRESARLAQCLGWRVVNPSLPGFGGSDPLPWGELSMPALAEQVELVARHVGCGPLVLLGHSMGGAVAVQYADDHPDQTLGIVYRDGVATPEWQERDGLLAALVATVAPDLAPLADMAAAIVLDAPDLFIGRLYSTLRSMIPEIRLNMRTMARTLPVGSMLLTVDLRDEVRRLAESGLPLLTEWGCFDRMATAATATEFAELSGSTVQWVPGGHSWMLARPQGQADLLTHLASGRRFVGEVEGRWRRLTETPGSLRAIV